jgi:uncharacterized GH25 family protein
LLAHDAWLEVNTNVVRTGDAAQLSLFLGNHGNDHRDFKVAGKADLRHARCEWMPPDVGKIDLKPQLFDAGYTPQEGFWTARLVAAQPGVHIVGYLADQVMSYAPVRSVKGAKTLFVASDSLDRVSRATSGFDRPLAHPLELVPVAHPVTPMGVGVPIRVRVLFGGKPLPGARVSFLPRSVTLSEEFDETYERRSDEHGETTFTPNLVLAT